MSGRVGAILRCAFVAALATASLPAPAGAASPVRDVATGAGDVFVGDGYALFSPTVGMDDAYVLRPVSSHPDAGALVAPLTSLADELTALTGATFTVGSAVADQTSTQGEITVELSTTSPCGPLDATEIGCGGFAADAVTDLIWFGNAWISPTVASDERLLRASVGHEVGHALGLSHYDATFHGQVQLMHTSMPDATLRHYRDGDVRGLRRSASNGYLDGAPAPALAPLAPEDLVAAAGPTSIDLAWSVVDQGSDVLGHEVEVAPAASTVGTATEVGPTTRTTVDGLTPGEAVHARVRARNAAGWGAWSAWSEPVVPDEVCLPPFPDVGGTHPFCADVAWLAGEGIATGYADGLFHPAAPVSRQAMAAFLRRYATLVDPAATEGPWPGIGFVDVAPTSPFREDVAWLAATGIATGYADGGFHPADPVSRQAMAAFLRRLAVLLWGTDAGAIPPGAVAFADVGETHPFHDDVAWMRLEGLSTGTPDTTCGCALYLPASAVSRQAMSAFLHALDTTAPPA